MFHEVRKSTGGVIHISFIHCDYWLHTLKCLPNFTDIVNFQLSCFPPLLSFDHRSWMSQETFFYCAPCRLKVLVLPLGNVRASYFSRSLGILRKHGTVIPFQNIDPEHLSKGLFNPAAFPQGQLLFEYVTDWEPHYAHVEDFQPWRKVYVVIILRILRPVLINVYCQDHCH